MIAKTIVYSCRKCGSQNIVKNGHNAYGSQQYWCKGCGKRGVLEPKHSYTSEQKEQILSSRTSALPEVYAGILAYLALVLFIRPKAELEIGKGRDAIQRWAIWQWLIALPAVFFIGDILHPRLVEFINYLLQFLH